MRQSATNRARSRQTLHRARAMLLALGLAAALLPVTAEQAVADDPTLAVGKSLRPTSGVAHTGAVTTVTLSARNNSAVAIEVPEGSFGSDQLSLEDPGTGSDATFDVFDFVGFGALTAPTGTTWQVSVHDGTTWREVGTYGAGATPSVGDLPVAGSTVQGVRYTLRTGGVAPGQSLTTTIDLRLRETRRGSGTAIDSGSVHNCATGTTGSFTATSCADYQINAVNPGTGVGVAKSIVAASLPQASSQSTDVTLTGRNGANVPASRIVLEDYDGIGDGSFWEAFTFDGFGATSWPTGTTGLLVQAYDGSTWTTGTSYTSASDLPPTLAGISAADVRGLRYTWSGGFAAGATVTARFAARLKDATQADPAVKNCVQQSYTGDLISTPVVSTACDTIAVVQTQSLTLTKTASGGDGTFSFTLAGPGGTTTELTTQDGTGSLSWGPDVLVAGESYTLTEQAAPGWVSGFDSCSGVTPASSTATSVTFVVALHAQISCSFSNAKQPTVTVVKTASGGDAAFGFALAGDGGSPVNVTTTDGDGSFTWDGLTPDGSYTLTETPLDGWTSEFVGCTGTQASADGLSVSFTAAAGAEIVCAYANTVIPQPTPTPTPTETDEPEETSEPIGTEDPEATLPNTGSNPLDLAGPALLLLAAGAGLLVITGRRSLRPRRH